MRNEALTGYLLHQRPYQEKRALYCLFSKDCGVVHGVGKKGAPLFEPLQLFATGKRDLKTFSQINIAQNDSVAYDAQRYRQINGQQQYAALYLNELLWKLLPTEDPMPALWQHYQHSLSTLKDPLDKDALRVCLRTFEQHLFDALGFSLMLTQDSHQDPITPDRDYRFLPDVGLMPIIAAESQQQGSTPAIFSGAELLAMTAHGITPQTLGSWSRLNRYLIDHLLDYKPLQSRLLWQQQQRYQS